MKSRNRSLSHRLILSSLLIFAVILMITISIFLYLLSSLKSYNDDMDQERVSSWQTWMDDSLLGLQKYATSLDSEPFNATLKSVEEPIQGRLPASVYWFSDSISNYANTNNLIKEVFIWYPQSDLIVGSIGCFSASSYYALMNSLSKDGEERYFNYLRGSQMGYSLYEGLDGTLRFSFIYPMYSQRRIAGYVVAEIDRDALFHLLGSYRNDSYYRTLIDGTVLSESGNSELLTSGSGTCFSSSSETARGLVYEYWRNSSVNDIAFPLLITIIGVVISVFITYFGSKRMVEVNSRPVNNILRFLGLEADSEPSLALERLESLATEKGELLERLDIQKRKLSSAFLQYVLINRLGSLTAVEEIAAYYSVEIECAGFAMIVITSKRDSNETIQQKIEDSFSNTIVTIVQDRVAILFLYDGTSDFSDFISETSVMGRDWRVGVGLSYVSLNNIVVSYSEALLALEYSQSGEYHIYSHGDYDLVPAEEIDIPKMFTAELEMGRFAEALKYLDGVFESLFDHNEDAILRKVKLKGIMDELQAVSDISTVSYDSEQILKECIRNILLGLIDTSRQSEDIQDITDGSAVEKAMKIIMLKFTDPMFGLSALSEMVGCSNTYLSTQFKAHYGINVSRFIQNLRIEKAKEMLLNTDMRVKDIALAVGFSSDIAFLRVFKKAENTTPGAMRREAGREDEPDEDEK